MRTKKTDFKTEVVEKTTTTVCCDLCGMKATNARSCCGAGNVWSDAPNDVLETDIRFRLGSRFPGGGSGISTVVDLCPTCFRTKLLPWLAEQGAEPTEEDFHWEHETLACRGVGDADCGRMGLVGRKTKP